MTKQILLWIDDTSYLGYSFSTIIGKETDHSFFGIADVNIHGKSFLTSQSLLKFSKLFFYRDCLSSTQNYNEQYLIDFEKKYNINLWTIIFSERLFYNFTTYHKPTKKEILLITEQTCRFFETILDEVNPDFIFIKEIDNFQNTILFELAKSKNIKILTFASAKLANASHISLDSNGIDITSNKTISDVDFENFIEHHDALKQDKKKKSIEMPTMKKRISKFLELLKIKSDPEYFPNYGKHSINFILKNITLTFKSFSRKRFLEKYADKSVENENIVYFPLHVEPEKATLITAPFFSDQINIISNIAKFLPVGYKLYVKEHGSMELYFWRDISFYKKILQLPNVKLIHPLVNPKTLMKKCSLVTTISGTAGLEALFLKKPVIVFSDVIYSNFPNVFRVTDFQTLPSIIKTALILPQNDKGMKKLVSLYENECLDVDMIDLQHECLKYIGSFGINDLVTPSQKKLEQFIDLNYERLEIVAHEHLRKMKLLEKNSVTFAKRKDTMRLN